MFCGPFCYSLFFFFFYFFNLFFYWLFFSYSLILIGFIVILDLSSLVAWSWPNYSATSCIIFLSYAFKSFMTIYSFKSFRRTLNVTFKSSFYSALCIFLFSIFSLFYWSFSPPYILLLSFFLFFYFFYWFSFCLFCFFSFLFSPISVILPNPNRIVGSSFNCYALWMDPCSLIH